ncbi:MAG: nucleoside triphosphate pyrophosphohydrolase [Bacteroidetes bacterium]|nr:MAG: nucleoside triphosphate pyrophosphohydrolase [Bacteroidota bacterium]
MKRELSEFKRLLEIMDELRAKCPWDKKQTLESLRYLTIEETYELSDAIIADDLDDIKKELGDLMLHIVFYSKIGSEKKAFDIADVLESINDKLVQRHPHIYGDEKVKDAREVLNNWEKIKIKNEGRKSVLGGVPKSLPPLVKAYRMQEKASGVGFDWESPAQVWDKVMEEMNEMRAEVESQDEAKLEEEFGDLLFALVNYSRFIGVNPEDALERTNIKFIRRFQYLEEHARADGKALYDMSLKEMDVYWEEAKKIERKVTKT